jgi:hypothetical protein
VDTQIGENVTIAKNILPPQRWPCMTTIVLSILIAEKKKTGGHDG